MFYVTSPATSLRKKFYVKIEVNYVVKTYLPCPQGPSGVCGQQLLYRCIELDRYFRYGNYCPRFLFLVIMSPTSVYQSDLKTSRSKIKVKNKLQRTAKRFDVLYLFLNGLVMFS